MAQSLDLGDKKYVLPSLLAEYAGKVNLIYIDPPFDTGAPRHRRESLRKSHFG
jgi:16S rRNA G966 N2-methylase RsmD